MYARVANTKKKHVTDRMQTARVLDCQIVNMEYLYLMRFILTHVRVRAHVTTLAFKLLKQLAFKSYIALHMFTLTEEEI